jgi:hypothetical protein
LTLPIPRLYDPCSHPALPPAYFAFPEIAMSWRTVAISVALALYLSQAAISAEPERTVFRAGAAKSNITPPLGMTILGSFDPQPSKSVHDELHARCLVLDDGRERLALVVCDLIGFHYLVGQEARKFIREATGIPPENVLVSATHTHSASSALGPGLNWYPREPKLDDYQRFVARRIADGVTRAVNSLRPAELAYGAIDVPEHVHNRRWFMRPGTMPENPFGTSELVKMNGPAGSPNLVEPAGPVDPQLTFLAVREPDGEPISVFAAYSLHYVGNTTPWTISADYFGVFCEELAFQLKADRLDPPFVAVLANGTSGDINNTNFRNPGPRKQPYEQMRYVAGDLATKVRESLSGLTYRRDLTLEARYREVPIGLRHPTAEQLEWAKKKLAEPDPPKGLEVQRRVYAKWFVDIADDPETALVPLQALRIGDVCLGTMPCEAFAEIGLDFKRRAPFKNAFIVQLAHAYLGYLPSPRHFQLGGYETWLGSNRLEPEASVKMTDELLKMAVELKSAAP